MQLPEVPVFTNILWLASGPVVDVSRPLNQGLLTDPPECFQWRSLRLTSSVDTLLIMQTSLSKRMWYMYIVGGF